MVNEKQEINGLYKCPVCDTYYTYSDEALDLITFGDGEQAVSICSNCSNKIVMGADKSTDDCYLFAREYEDSKHRTWPHFKSISLEECSKDEAQAEAYEVDIGDEKYGRSVYLKIGDKPS